MLTLRIPQTTVEYKYIIIHMEILGYQRERDERSIMRDEQSIVRERVVFVYTLTSDLSRSTLLVNS